MRSELYRTGHHLRTAVSGCSAILLLAACGKAPAPPAPPPSDVTVAKPIARQIVEHNVYTGRLAAIQNVSVRPRVSGYITEIPFKEGTIVKKDDLLFVIDPRPYQAALDQAAGQLAQAKAQQELSNQNFTRAQSLQATKVSSKEEFDTAATNRNQSDAQVATAQAAVNAAQLNLGFTKIISPIDGRVSREDVTIGNLVASDSTVLTNIVSVDPIYAYADVDEAAVINYQKLIAEGKVKSARDSSVAVDIELEGEEGFPHHGVIDFIDNQINAATGTLAVRGVFPNADGNLLPGMFVRMQIPTSGEISALLITDRAVGSDQGQKFVYVLAGDQTDRRPVTLGPEIDGLRVVTQGLKPDDEVVIEGLMKLRPGAPVKAGTGRMDQFASPQLDLRPTLSSPPPAKAGK
jgi:multidrug efflux system membrane fusion protein